MPWEDLIEGANGKPVLVAYWFKHDLDRIKTRLKIREIKTSADIRDWNFRKYPGGSDTSRFCRSRT